MEKLLYSGPTISRITRIMGIRRSSELVAEKIGEASFLMEGIYHHPCGVTLRFDYHKDLNNDKHMTELSAFGEEDKISQIEKALNPPTKNPMEFSEDWVMDASGHEVPISKEYEQTLPTYTTIPTAEGVLGVLRVGEE